jgi:hypothetical protein
LTAATARRTIPPRTPSRPSLLSALVSAETQWRRWAIIVGCVAVVIALGGAGWYFWGVELTLTSIPSGAQVFLDGRQVGTTDAVTGRFVLPRFHRRSHTLLLKRDGYADWTQTLEVPATTFSATLTATLAPAASATAPGSATGAAPNSTGWTYLQRGQTGHGVRFEPSGAVVLANSDGNTITLFNAPQDVGQITVSPASPSGRYVFIVTPYPGSKCFLWDRQVRLTRELLTSHDEMDPWVSWSPGEAFALLAQGHEGSCSFFTLNLANYTLSELTRAGWAPPASQIGGGLSGWGNEIGVRKPDLESVRWLNAREFQLRLTLHCNPYDETATCDPQKVTGEHRLVCTADGPGCVEEQAVAAPKPQAAPDRAQVEQLVTAADRHFQQGEFQRALEACDAALRLDPKHARARELQTKIKETMKILGIK